MFLFYGLILLFAFFSLLIDFEYLAPAIAFRVIWDLLILAIGVYFLIRIRSKIKEGSLEQLQADHHQLNLEFEEKRYSALRQRVEHLENLLAAMERKK